MIDYKNSIVLIGGVGAGKSFLANKLSQTLSMPKLTTDEFRHLPHLDKIKNLLSESSLSQKQFNELNYLLELRKQFPFVINYEDFGFNGEVSQFLRNNFGEVAWHFYQKQFEQLLLENICENVNGAVILDLGGGMPISLDNDYAVLANNFLKLNANLFNKEFKHLNKIGFNNIQNVLNKFENVFYLQMPTDLANHGTRANADKLNEKFITSNQYKMASRNVKIINVEGMFTDEKILNKVLNQIINSKKMQH